MTVRKISIIGSGGVGSSLAFHLLNRLTLEDLVLVDICEGLAKGIALDLEDTRGFLGFNTKITGTKNFSHIKNSDIIVITAGFARKQGMTRLDLLKKNAGITGDIALKIKKLCPSSMVIVVTNPLDVITYVVAKRTGFPRKRVIGMGPSLDTSRLLNILYQEGGISTDSLEAYVFGFHSKDMIVSPERIKVKGERLSKYLSSKKIDIVKNRVQFRGAEIVGFLKNRSATFAPSLSCCFLIEAIAKDKNSIIPVSMVLKGEYGAKDICLGVPCLINRKGADKIIEISLTAQEKKRIKQAKTAFSQAKAAINIK